MSWGYRKRNFRRKVPAGQFDAASYAKGIRAGIAKAKGGYSKPRYRRRY